MQISRRTLGMGTAISALGALAACANQGPGPGQLTPVSPGPALAMTYRQGVVKSFDPATLENTVLAGGTLMSNLPILGVAEAATLTVGSLVGIATVSDGRGGQTWAIIGRFVTPGTDAATDAISQLANRFASASVATSESPAGSAYGDMATPGPFVEATIGPSGRALVIVSAVIAVNVPGAGSQSAYMAYSISGGTTRAAADGTSLYLSGTAIGVTGMILLERVASSALEEGLTPGANRFTTAYRCAVGDTPANSALGTRNITVLAL